jgi:hypothetical protein
MQSTMAMFTRTLAMVGRSTITAAGIRRTNLSPTGKARKIINNGREANPISNEHHLKAVPPLDLVKAAVTIDPLKPALSVPVAVSTDPAAVNPVIWTARLRTGHEAIFRVSVSRVFQAEAATALAAEADSVVIVSVVAAGAAIASVVEHSAAVAASADSAAAAGADGNNLVLDLFLISDTTKKLSQPTQTNI